MIYVLENAEAKNHIPEERRRRALTMLGFARRELELAPIKLRWFSRQPVDDPVLTLSGCDSALGVQTSKMPDSILIWTGIAFDDDEMIRTIAHELMHHVQRKMPCSDMGESIPEYAGAQIAAAWKLLAAPEKESALMDELMMTDFSRKEESIPKPAEVTMKSASKKAPRRVEKIGRIIGWSR